MQAVDSPLLGTRGGATIAGTPPEAFRDDEGTPPIPALVLVAPATGDHASSRRQAFGRRMQAAREHRGVSLEEIAQATKMSASLLAALERGDASRWPKGLFRRAFFRDYAFAIGLPAEPTITEFLRLFPDGEEHPMPAAAAEPEAAPSLRLSLAPQEGWRIPRVDLRQESVTAGVVLLLAFAVTFVMGGTPLTFLAAFGLCYSSRIAAAIVRRLTL
jgi:transcriptional regulator with XRE-family HTH domain